MLDTDDLTWDVLGELTGIGRVRRPELLFKLLVLNEGEAKLLTGQQNLMTSAQSILEMGPKVVIIKKGERGFELNIGQSDHGEVEGIVSQSISGWINLLSRGFQAVGYRVKIYE